MIRRTVTACIVAFAAAAGANADTVEMKYLGTGAGKTVKISHNGSTKNVFAGQIRHEISNGTGLGAQFSGEFMTFCSEITQYVTSTKKVYRVTGPEDISTPAIGEFKAQAISNLYSYVMSAPTESGVNADYAAAFQLAVWEIVYDFSTIEGASSLDVEDGAFQARNTNDTQLSATIRGYLTDFFNAAFSFQSNAMLVYGLQNDSAQDQLIATPTGGTIVPLPGAGVMGLAGIGLIANRRRRA